MDPVSKHSADHTREPRPSSVLEPSSHEAVQVIDDHLSKPLVDLLLLLRILPVGGEPPGDDNDGGQLPWRYILHTSIQVFYVRVDFSVQEVEADGEEPGATVW